MSNKFSFTFLTKTEVINPRGNNDAWWIDHSSYGKEHKYDEESPSPYLAANEWICGHIGDFLRLGVPPFALFKEHKGSTFFASLQFTRDKTPPADIRPVQCWKNMPNKCAGVLLFDILIGNDDRRCDQMVVDNPVNPKVLTVYDHDQGLFGGMLHDGEKRVTRLLKTDALEIGYHCFLDVVNTDEHFEEWYHRIGSIPEWYIQEVCDDAAMFDGVTKKDVKAAAKLLIHRSRYMRDIVRKNRDKFPMIKRWGTLI